MLLSYCFSLIAHKLIPDRKAHRRRQHEQGREHQVKCVGKVEARELGEDRGDKVAEVVVVDGASRVPHVRRRKKT